MQRRTALRALAVGATLGTPRLRAEDTGGDPYGSFQWPELKREFLVPAAPVVFDPRVQVQVPPFAEDAMNVPVTIAADGLAGVQRLLVLVDRNPIRQVIELQPLHALPRVSLRFKLEQASPVRAAVLAGDGRWHVGSGFVDSAGGGCTLPGASRSDGSWSSTLGTITGRVFPSSPAGGGARVRVRVMHPMDTGLANGIPAFYLQRLSLLDARGRELLRLKLHEPISENPLLSFDFADPPPGPLRLVGTDNNGNRFDGTIP